MRQPWGQGATTWLAALVMVANCGSDKQPEAPPAATGETAPAEPIPEADPREPLLAETIVTALRTRHLRARPLDDALSREAFGVYLRELDPGKLFLYQADVDALAAYDLHLDDQLLSGHFSLAHAGADTMTRRRSEAGRYIAERLTRPFDFTVQEQWESDASKLPHVTTELEFQDRWRKLLKLQVLQRAAIMDPGEPLAIRTALARAELADSYSLRFKRIAQGSPLEPAELFINAVMAVFDPHTRWLPPAARESFDIAMTGSLVGIGAVLVESGHYIRVREIYPGGAAARHGELAIGDFIVAVSEPGSEPVNLKDMRITEVVKLIRGEQGTPVTLSVRRGGKKGATRSITIVRSKVELTKAYARAAVLDVDGARIGYIDLPQFYGDTRHRKQEATGRSAGHDVRRLLQALTKQQVAGVVLDLRGNAGGLLDDAVLITGLFIEAGPVVQTRAANSESSVYTDKDKSVVFDGPVVVLIDRVSASSSEIVASALQDYRRAIIVGTSASHGKGTVQALIDLNALHEGAPEDLGVLKLTMQQFYGIDGESTQWRGVVPDILLPDPRPNDDSGERSLEHSLPWSRTDPLAFRAWPRGMPDKLILDGKSQARQRSNPQFSQVVAESQRRQQAAVQTDIPLQIDQWLERRAEVAEDAHKQRPPAGAAAARLQVTAVEAADAKGEQASLTRWLAQVGADPWLAETARICRDAAELTAPVR